MPGKVKPTQLDALTLPRCQVMSNDVAISIGVAGNFELNMVKPLLAYDFLQSCACMADAMQSFEATCVPGIVANRERIAELLERSFLLVTALAPHFGCDRAAARGVLAGAQTRSRRQAKITCVTRPGDPDPSP